MEKTEETVGFDITDIIHDIIIPMSTSININDYKYKYEMHLHTNEASRCAVNTGAEMARAHKEAGYTGIVVTNHAWGGNTCVDRHLPYAEWVKEYSKGFYEAQKEGDRIELDVFFGMESGFNGTEFLIYGITPEWLLKNPELWDADIEKQYDIVKSSGGVVMHAHPFREEYYIPQIRLYPQFVDGVEIANATHSSPLSKSHNNPLWDELAAAYALEHKLSTCGGSDVHSTNVLGGGTIFKEKLCSSQDFEKAFTMNGDYILSNGAVLLDKTGTPIK